MFNLKRVLLLAGMRLGIPEALQFMQQPLAPAALVPPPDRMRGVGRSGSPDRLYLDRSSSVRKLQRWLNEGEIMERPPSEQARQRHIHPRHKRKGA